jgi:hypothetical protein
MPALEQDGAEAPLPQMVDQARAGDAATDHKHVGAVGQISWVAL